MAVNNKMVVYQVFTRLFGNRNTTNVEGGTLEQNGSGKFADFDSTTLRRIRSLGATHVWYTGIIRHATATDYSSHGIPRQHPAVVKGVAGSPYAICDYYDVDPDLAVDVDKRMDEWEQLIQRTHKAGLKVVMDFVPNHVARQYLSIARPEGVTDLGADDVKDWNFRADNNFYYCGGAPFSPSFSLYDEEQGEYTEQPARATGNDRFDAAPDRNDWYETIKLNYGTDYNYFGHREDFFWPHPDTWHKMRDILLYWASKGVDAFRCDMAEMVPAAFWHYVTKRLHEQYPDVQLIGEVYNPDLYHKYIAAGFDYLYDKVGMYDTLRHICSTPEASTQPITWQWQKVDDIRDHMLYFLENHDEQRIASDFFCGDARKAVPALIISAMLYKNPVMIYAGQEFGEKGMDKEGFSGKDGRTTIFDYWCVDTLRRGYYDRRHLTSEEKQLEELYKRILVTARDCEATSEGLTYDLMYCNSHLNRQYAFLRRGAKETLLACVNFDEKPAQVELTIPEHAFDYLSLPEGEFDTTDLLTDKMMRISLKRTETVKLSVPAHSGVIVKM